MYVENGQLMGLEVDLARRLADELGRPVEMTGMPWKNLVGALQSEQIDVIMGGITVTDARRLIMDFTEPILESGLMALVRASDRNTIRTPADVGAHGRAVGVMPATSSKTFVQRAYPHARLTPVLQAKDVPILLQRRALDAFVHDLPAVIWMHSLNESDTALVPEPLQREQIAWAVRRGDADLKSAIDSAIAKWTSDGSLRATIETWLPYYSKLTAPPKP